MRAIFSRSILSVSAAAALLIGAAARAQVPELPGEELAPPVGYAYSGPASRSSPRWGFLWRPDSYLDGKAVVLLPKETAGHVGYIALFEDFPIMGQHPIDVGRYVGEYHDLRPVVRFRHPGRAFRRPLFVIVRLKGGWEYGYYVPRPAKRHADVFPALARFEHDEDPGARWIRDLDKPVPPPASGQTP